MTAKLSAYDNIRQIQTFEAKVQQTFVIAIANVIFNFHQRSFYLSITWAKYLQYAIVLSKVK